MSLAQTAVVSALAKVREYNLHNHTGPHGMCMYHLHTFITIAVLSETSCSMHFTLAAICYTHSSAYKGQKIQFSHL